MAGKQNMADKEYIDDVLLTAKTLSGLYHYATQESTTEPAHCNFKDMMNESIDMQNQIYNLMQTKGWYQQQQAQPQQISQVKTKFTN